MGRSGRLVALVGPTATGKSQLGLDLAEALDAEIIGADAMALYCGMDIGTAKTPPNQRRGIAHHLIDVLEVTQEASVAAYQRYARLAAEQIWSRGKTAIVVGGSGLYLRAMLDQIDFPATDPQIRAKWLEKAQTDGPQALHQELSRLDPSAAAVIEPGNTRRLARALEVIELTGQPFKAQLPKPQAWRPLVYLGLDLEDDLLDQRIASRVAGMWQAGLLEEVAALDRQGLRQGKTAARAIGYQQGLAVLDGLLTEEQAQASMTLATCQLARRQRKWFRREGRINWLDTSAPLGQAALALINAHSWD